MCLASPVPLNVNELLKTVLSTVYLHNCKASKLKFGHSDPNAFPLYNKTVKACGTLYSTNVPTNT